MSTGRRRDGRAGAAGGGALGLALGPEAGAHLVEGERRLLSAGPDELPEGGIGLQDHGLPVVPVHADEDGDGLPVAGDDDPISLRGGWGPGPAGRRRGAWS